MPTHESAMEKPVVAEALPSGWDGQEELDIELDEVEVPQNQTTFQGYTESKNHSLHGDNHLIHYNDTMSFQQTL